MWLSQVEAPLPVDSAPLSQLRWGLHWLPEEKQSDYPGIGSRPSPALSSPQDPEKKIPWERRICLDLSCLNWAWKMKCPICCTCVSQSILQTVMTDNSKRSERWSPGTLSLLAWIMGQPEVGEIFPVQSSNTALPCPLSCPGWNSRTRLTDAQVDIN